MIARLAGRCAQELLDIEDETWWLVRRCAEPEKAATGMYSEIQTTLPGSPRKLNQGWVPEQHVRVLAVRPAVALGAAHDSSQGRRDHFRDGAPVAWAGQMTSRSHRVRA